MRRELAALATILVIVCLFAATGDTGAGPPNPVDCQAYLATIENPSDVALEVFDLAPTPPDTSHIVAAPGPDLAVADYADLRSCTEHQAPNIAVDTRVVTPARKEVSHALTGAGPGESG